MLNTMNALPNETAWSVSTLTRYIRDLIETDTALQQIWVQGEISNLSRPRSGHVYFTLKDASAALKCVIWRSRAGKIPYALQDGLDVMVYGSLGVYENGGQYQLYVETLRPLGQGDLYEAFLRLKAQLEAEGLFDPARKRPLPDFPQRIGIVTSATGAALQDMLNTIRRRYPLASVLLSPSLVQGEGAPESLVRALSRLMVRDDVDVILIARGGGSLEDLWAFNDEHVVRTVAASPVPVISGVGHETDFTLTDFAADRRAPTPTAAAELATPITQEALLLETERFAARLETALRRKLDEESAFLARAARDLAYLTPQRRVQDARQSVDALSARLDAARRSVLRETRHQLAGLAARLQGLNPRAVLQRGYASLQRADDGGIVSSRRAAQPGQRLRALLSDGEIWLTVEAQPDDG